MANPEYIVFDFDHTLYAGDCTIAFHRFMLGKKPSLLRHLPVQICYYVSWKLTLLSTGRFKEKYLSFLDGIAPDGLNALIAEFWESKQDGFNQPVDAILKQKTGEGHACVVITASPQTLVSYVIGKRYGTDCIGTLLAWDGRSYRLQGPNCKGPEKINRFEKQYGKHAVIVEAYSDNASDAPLFEKAKHAFKIRGQKITPLK